MKHKWEIETVDATAGGLDIGRFWICWECGTSGGPVGFTKAKEDITTGPHKPWMFLAGTPLWELSQDCEEAKKTIDDYVAKHPDYEKELARSRNKPQSESK